MRKKVFAGPWTELVMCAALTIGLSTGAFASCGDSLAAIATGKAMVISAVGKQRATASPGRRDNQLSIVGLWYVQSLECH